MKKPLIIILNFFIVICCSFNINAVSQQNLDFRNFLQKGKKYWNKWRAHNSDTRIVISGSSCAALDLSNFNLQKVNFINAIFYKNNFSYADLRDALFQNVEIALPYAPGRKHVYRTVFYHAKLNRSKIIGSKMTMAVYEYVDFSNAQIINSKFWVSRFNYPKFNYAKITKSFLGETILFADFSNAIISSSEIDNKIENAKFYRSNIINSSFGELGYPRVRGLSKTKIYNSDFTFSVIKKSRFFANIFHSNFSNAKIFHTKFIMDSTNHLNFSNTILTDSSFTECYLTNVNFTNANLTNVDFQKVKFQNVIFRNANMTGVKIERKWYNYLKTQEVKNFDKIRWQ